MERCTWTKKEDQCLKLTVESMSGQIDWKVVTQILETKYQIYQKTAKKCRQRWNTKINPAFDSKNWTVQEQNLMLQLQSQLGNKWSIIRNFFQRRTDVFIKNQFYSIFRKALRKINDYLVCSKKFLPLRQFSSALMNSVLVVNQTRFTNNFDLPKELINLSQHIKQIIIRMNSKQNQQKNELMEQVIIALIQFKKEYNPNNKGKCKANNPRTQKTSIIFQQIQKTQNEIFKKNIIKKEPIFYQHRTLQESISNGNKQSIQNVNKSQGFVKMQFCPQQQTQLSTPNINHFPLFFINTYQNI